MCDESILCKLFVFGKNGFSAVFGLHGVLNYFSLFGIGVNYDFLTIRKELVDELVTNNLFAGDLDFGLCLDNSKKFLKLVMVPIGYALGGLFVVLNKPSCPLLYI